MYFCRRCNYTTIRYTNLRRHMSVHLKSYAGHIQCSLCNYRSSRKQNVTRHLIKKHNGKGDVITGSEPNVVPKRLKTIFITNFKCNLCSFSSTKEKEVIQHQSKVHGGKGIVLTDQMEVPKTHLDPSPEPLPDPNLNPQQKIVFAANFQCSACNYRSVKKEDVVQHQTLKHGSEEPVDSKSDTCSEIELMQTKKTNPEQRLYENVLEPAKRLLIMQTQKTHQDQRQVEQENEDESEPAKRLLLAECGLIWHSKEFSNGNPS